MIGVHGSRGCPSARTLFAATMAENIASTRRAQAERDRAGGSEAGAREFIHALPEGLDTQHRRRRRRLSAGQAQRIALARTFLRMARCCPDEPTAHLDEARSSRSGGSRGLAQRTTLLIVHHPAIAEHADDVIRLDGGRAVQRGRSRAGARDAGADRERRLQRRRAGAGAAGGRAASLQVGAPASLASTVGWF